LVALDNFANTIKQLDEVNAVIGLPMYIKIMNRFMSEDRDEAFVITTHERAEGAIGEALYWYTGGTPGAFDAIVDPTYKEAMMVVFVRDTSQATVAKVSGAVREYITNVWDPDKASGVQLSMAGGSVGIAEAFNRHVKDWLIITTVLGFIGTVLILIPLLRSLLLPLLLIVPLVIAVVFTVAIMILLDIEINSNSAAALAIASGVGVDSGIYLLFRVREEYLIRRNFREALVNGFVKIWRALAISNGALIVGCWALAPIPLYVGYVGFGMGLIVLLCFVLTGVLSPVLWHWIGEKTVIGKVEAIAGDDAQVRSRLAVSSGH
jgi:predicted RND superfamily exporter protein